MLEILNDKQEVQVCPSDILFLWMREKCGTWKRTVKERDRKREKTRGTFIKIPGSHDFIARKTELFRFTRRGLELQCKVIVPKKTCTFHAAHAFRIQRKRVRAMSQKQGYQRPIRCGQ